MARLETLDDDEIAELDELDELARLETLDDDEITELDELNRLDTGAALLGLEPVPEPPQAISRAEVLNITNALIIFITKFSCLCDSQLARTITNGSLDRSNSIEEGRMLISVYRQILTTNKKLKFFEIL